MARLDRAVADGIERLQAGHDLARGEDLDLELAVGDVRDLLGEHLAAAIDRVERLREARRRGAISPRDWIARWRAWR